MKIKNKKLFILLLSIISFSNCLGQNIQLLSKNKNGTIQLRWVTTDSKLFRKGLANGYTLTRQTLRRNNKKISKPEIITIVNKPFGQEKWKYLAEKNDFAKVIKGYLYDDPIISNDAEEIENAWNGRLIFMLFCADRSPEVARGLALGYTDSTAKANEFYKYSIQLNEINRLDPKNKTEISAGLMLNIYPELPKKLEVIDFADSNTTLKWILPTRTIYSAYNIERSDDNGFSYFRVNETPYLPFGNDSSINYLTYSNKIKVLQKTYHYRVRGLDPFGDESDPSNIAQVYAYQTRIVPPSNFQYIFPNPSTALLSWKYPDSLKINIKGFNVYKDLGPKETNIKVNKELITDKLQPFTIDKIRPYTENIVYYLAAVDLRGKETVSDPYLVAIKDSIAPQKITNLKGKISKQGQVTLNWTKSVDKDVAGYRVYRAEGNRRNDMYLIYTTEKLDSMAKDNILIRAASKYVYYIVAPFDNYFNFSKKNDTLRLVRPHVIPPDPPIFTNLYNTDSTVVLNWIPSSSIVVAHYKLKKSYPADTTKKTLLTFEAKQMLTEFADKNWDEEVPMIYYLEAIDSIGLSSGDSCHINVLVPRADSRPPIKLLKGKYNKNEKAINLTWTYPIKKPVRQFWIFKKENGIYQKIAETNGDEFHYADTHIKEDMEYSYFIKAICIDNSRSNQGFEVNIQTK